MNGRKIQHDKPFNRVSATTPAPTIATRFAGSSSPPAFSRPIEVDIAVELVEERLEEGPQSGYHFVFAELDGRTVGYTCYGPIALTAASFDLYWIAVDKSLHGRKIGQALLEKTEELVRQAGGRQLYIETSNRHQYAPTRGFYLRGGYHQEALLKDFYAPEDDKVIYVKSL